MTFWVEVRISVSFSVATFAYSSPTLGGRILAAATLTASSPPSSGTAGRRASLVRRTASSWSASYWGSSLMRHSFRVSLTLLFALEVSRGHLGDDDNGDP